MIQINQNHTFRYQTEAINLGNESLNSLLAYTRTLNSRIANVAFIALALVKIFTVPITVPVAFVIDLSVALCHATIALAKGLGRHEAFEIYSHKMAYSMYRSMPIVVLALGLTFLTGCLYRMFFVCLPRSGELESLEDIRYLLEYFVLMIFYAIGFMWLLSEGLPRAAEQLLNDNRRHGQEISTTVHANALQNFKVGGRHVFTPEDVAFLERLQNRAWPTGTTFTELDQMHRQTYLLARKVDKFSAKLQIERETPPSLFKRVFSLSLFGYSCSTHIDQTRFQSAIANLRRMTRNAKANGRDLTNHWNLLDACRQQIQVKLKISANAHPYERLLQMVLLGTASPEEIYQVAEDIDMKKYVENKLQPEARLLVKLIEAARITANGGV